MSCCGQKRAALKSAAAAMRARMHAAARPAVHAPKTTAAVEPRLRYLGTAAIALRGPRSGRVYRCAAGEDAIAIDRLDLDALLATRLFACAPV